MSSEKNPLLLDEPGKRMLMVGNQAIVRGALEADVDVVAGYPGTPSSEVLEMLNEMRKQLGIYAEISVNEMVAAEVAGGAAAAGLKALVTMKHVGVNVASDFFNVINMTGIDGALVIYVGDDPGAWVSQNEQDTRIYCEMFHFPCLEPYDQQTAKDLMIKAFELSKKYSLPVIVRSTHRIAHASGSVTIGKLPKYPKELPEGKFVKNLDRWYTGDVFIQKLHKELHEKLYKIQGDIENLNHYYEKGNSKIGIIADGINIMYAREALQKLGLEGKVSILGLVGVFPVPRKVIANFINGLDKVLIAEETEPYLENYVNVIAHENGLSNLKVYGRNTGNIPWSNELNSSIIANALVDIAGKELGAKGLPEIPTQVKEAVKKAQEITPFRYLTFCAGCPHQGTFYALKMALLREGVKIDNIPIILDIGCYGLAPFSPMRIGDVSLNMGSGFGFPQGLRVALKTKDPVIGIVGDSTFFHASMPALINAKWNGQKGMLFIVADNRITAMTGGQPNPSSGMRGDHSQNPSINAEDVIKAMGYEVEVIDPYDVKGSIEAFRKAIKKIRETGENVVVVSKRGCALYVEPPKTPYYIDPDKCTGCRVCLLTLGCQALQWDSVKKKAHIADELCVGCGVCAQVCPYNAIIKPEGGKQ
ncbi:indolepyruvate ferredoxin oxidoreductase subunit alpha [Fervidicoccus fontis]|uniref:Indolepyruvate oxidoreductase subunit IorA n=1 Tax=Fervidicoccus fontis (strain DSM 19380 / JCM 18336 / VKM B-2539 / Kam940) TaxID=1163730 RepID=I0A0A8_FERFK|nr:indolepyruvate ferredoxin oxidoreductase subunit alpha [Fervidicoccus fontis]AFH42415.1 Indolepyruvate:ferredoxin oxidoreductase subunit alpha [Fervidicoccus fontis Kam940]